MSCLPRFPGLSLALLGFLAAVTPSLAQNAKLDAALSNSWWGHVPIMLAVDKGFFKEARHRRRGEVGRRPRPTASGAVTSGSVAFSNLGRIAVISEMANDNKTFYFFANVDDSPGNEGCWARPGFASFKDLKGKKVAANTSAQITMNGLLENEGMTEKDVQFVNLPGGEMAGAIARGDVDAACVWEPLFTNVKNAAPGGKLLGTDMDTPNFKKFGTMASPDIMIISRKLVDEQPDSSPGRSLSAIFKGVKYTNENPEDTAKTVAHYFRQDAGGRARRHEAVQVFRRGQLAESHEAAYRPDGIPVEVAGRQWQDRQDARRQVLGESELHSEVS